MQKALRERSAMTCPRIMLTMRGASLSIAIFLLIAPLMAATAPKLLGQVERARSLSGKPWNQRRIAIFGDWYADLREIRRIIPADERVAIIPKSAADGDIAMFIIYHLYPRPTRLFWSFGDRERNQHEGGDRTVPPASWIVVVNSSRRPTLQLMRVDHGNYSEIALR